MSTPGSTGIEDARVRRDIEAYWEVHTSVEEEVRNEVIDELRADPALQPIIDAAAGDEQASAERHALMDRAVRDGNWEPYLDRLRGEGRAYADMGLEFVHWFRMVNTFRWHVVPHLIDAYRDDPDRLAAAVRGKGVLYDLALQTIGESYLDTRQEIITKQQAAIAELSTPVLQIRPGLLLMPVIGVIDTVRSRQLTESLLRTIRDRRARVVVMDITGVSEVDSEVANRLIQAAEAARLMGATPILTGISPGVAQTLVALGVDLKGLRTVGDLQGGIYLADELLGIRTVWERGTPPDDR